MFCRFTNGGSDVDERDGMPKMYGAAESKVLLKKNACQTQEIVSSWQTEQNYYLGYLSKTIDDIELSTYGYDKIILLCSSTCGGAGLNIQMGSPILPVVFTWCCSL